MSRQNSSKKNLLAVNAHSFDYETLEKETQVLVKQRAVTIKNLVRQTAQNMVEIGQNLNQVQQELGYGKFRRWLNSEFNWSVSKATKLMQVAERFKSVNFTHLNLGSSALYLLAAPSTPETARQEALNRSREGTYISYSVAKAIVCQHKQSSPPQEDGLNIKVEVEPEVEKLGETSVNFPLSQPERQGILEEPAKPANVLLHGDNKLTVNQELQPESEMIYDIGKAEDQFSQISDLNFFKKCLGREWRRLKREKDFLSLICCSIDNFDLFNPQSSDLEKKSCLAKVAQALENNVRRPTDLITYFGGEKFIIALPNTKPQEAKKVAEAITATVRQFQITYPLLNHHNYVTVSLGIAGTVPMLELSLKRLVSAVEKALLNAQKQGGNCAVISNWELTLPR